MLRVHTRNLGNVTVFCLQGRIVNGEKASLRQAMDSQLRTSVVVLDLGRVSAIDASGLGLMLELRQQAESRGMRFKLMNVTKLVSQVLEVTRLDTTILHKVVTRSVTFTGCPRGRFVPAISSASVQVFRSSVPAHGTNRR